jgi:tRNA 2-thiouridine synthesizing protein A
LSAYRTNAHRSRLVEPEAGAQGTPEPEVVDATGLKCPEPVMMLHNAIRKALPGGHVLLEATDPSTQRDVPQFCKFLEHQLLDSSADEAAGRYSFLIEKQPS